MTGSDPCPGVEDCPFYEPDEECWEHPETCSLHNLIEAQA